MSLIEIRAKFSCDSCGKTFSVAIDAARKLPPDWSIYDEAEDCVRGSLSYEGPRSRGMMSSVGGGDEVSVDGNHPTHLCAECTHDADEQQEAK